QGNHDTAKMRAYWLMAKTYKGLQQGELALKFMNLALEKKDTKVEAEVSKQKVIEKKKLKKADQGVDKGAVQDVARTVSESANIPAGNQEVKKEVESFSSSGSKDFSNKITLPASHHEDMAEIQILLENYELSNAYYKKYQKLVKGNEKRVIAYKIAQNLYAAKKYEDAIVAYEDLLKTEKDEVKIALCNSRIAGCKISTGKTEEGINIYQNTLLNTTFSTEANEEESPGFIEFKKNNDVVTKALRDQNKFEEEADLRSDIAEITRDNLEYLKLAQSYYQVGKVQNTEQALDKYFKDISYNGIEIGEIEVIKKMAEELNSKGKYRKAYQYLHAYELISDSIKVKIKSISGYNKRLGAIGVQNVLDLKIMQKDKEISDNMISHLVNEQDAQEDALGFQKTIIYLLSFLILVSLGTTIYIVRVSKQRRIANQQLAIRSLRSQMNPHFIFNALNSVNSFISMNDERSANKFLSEFSTLMRSVMENSEHNFIPLAKELEIIELYLGLEHYRFKDKFKYKLKIDDNLDEDEMQLPPMLIQPYIENAIWHGLRYIKTEGELLVSFDKVKNDLVVTIQDDGIGRKKSQELKTKNQKKNKSTAIKNIDQRIKLISALHHIDVKVDIQDLNQDGSGTKITLVIPQINTHS
ncbi:MAG: two-component system LytT family sensor kinase, partial [Glaciecola sp.]